MKESVAKCFTLMNHFNFLFYKINGINNRGVQKNCQSVETVRTKACGFSSFVVWFGLVWKYAKPCGVV